MIDPALLAECRDIAHAVAPELKERPLYVLDASALEGLPTGGCPLGWAFADRIVYPQIRERIGDAWRGVGEVVVLDGEVIREHSRPDRFEACVKNVFLHELGHVLPCRKIVELPDDPPPVFREKMLKRMADGWAQPVPKPGAADDAHDVRFARRCCHLMARALAAGVDTFVNQVLGPANEWQHASEDYMIAMVGEVVAMRDASFVEIERAPLPAALVELWNWDLENYQRF